MCGGLAPASHARRNAESGVGRGRARCRLQQRAAPQRLERLAPGCIEGRDVEVLVVELHVSALALGVGAVPGKGCEERQGQRRPAARDARAVGTVGEPSRSRHAEQRAGEGHEVATLVAPQIADRRPGAQIEEDVIGMHDHVHDRALDRGCRHDQHDERGHQRGCKQHPARQQDQEGDERQRHGRGEKNVGQRAFVDPEMPHQDRGDQCGDSPRRRRTELDASQQLRCTGAQPGSSRPSCRKAQRMIRHGPTVEPRHKSFTDEHAADEPAMKEESQDEIGRGSPDAGSGPSGRA